MAKFQEEYIALTAMFREAYDRLEDRLNLSLGNGRRDDRTFGTNKKKCKSCEKFGHCHLNNFDNPKQTACKEYKKRKK